MINSGSKGKTTNIAQMVACLGQQNVMVNVFQMDLMTEHYPLL